MRGFFRMEAGKFFRATPDGLDAEGATIRKKSQLDSSEEIRVEIESERATSDKPGRVLVYKGKELVAEVIAEVELKKGADSDYYYCVTLKRKQ